ncbi:MAG: carbohydrate ABC transporter substrate-binding protein [Helcococcus sp.]|nr:carbohydrate ABC transporter substrate-binding protein [Helcococcus sp.]
MLKKTLSLLLALALVFSLVACNGGTDKDKTNTETKVETNGETKVEGDNNKVSSDLDFSGKTITLAGLEGGYGLEGWKKVISQFEQLTGAKVEATFAQNIEEVVRPQITAGAAPDVLYVSLGREQGLAETLIREKAVLDITDMLSMKVPGEDVTVKDKIIPGFLETFTTNPYGDGKTYLAPIFYSPNGLFYNNSLFTTGGGELTVPTDVDELVALKGKVDGASVLTYPTAGYFDQVFYSLVNSVGGLELFNKLMTYDVDAWTNDAKPVFEAVGKMVSVLNPNTVAQANSEQFTQNQLQVMKNESLMMPNGTWIVGEMADANSQAVDGFEWALAPIPAVNKGGDRYAYSFTEQVYGSANTAEPELVKTFIAYLYSDEAVKTFIENGSAVMPTVNAVDMISDPQLKSFYSIYEDGVKAALGNFQSAPAVEGVTLSSVLFDNINAVATGDMTVDQWHKAVVDAITKISEAINAQ